MQLKNFQDKVVEQLKTTFYQLWQGGNRGVPLVFKSPTGSGKTIMMAEFLRPSEW
ncbi:DEAD/DEAH box helicase family protein [Abyssogena phaseoliformis symbiont]|uniref:DEAD/DEAH box helicase family protein n=1 Tax=Abyssogena phaseoliformis symbiont TaxID=596095 RepID=UPI001915C75D|nr:DEAD/DEAH box helicase family protein [Abyssogena phaseoliformis symbiont]